MNGDGCATRRRIVRCVKTLLVVHHSPSPTTHELLDAVLAGARDPEIEGVEVKVMPALAATVPDVLAADGYLFGTTANFGYMSGALKHVSHVYPAIAFRRRSALLRSAT